MKFILEGLIMELKRYKRVCPFCKALCWSVVPMNIICKCNAKYYYFDKVWLDRSTGEEVWENAEAEK
jgi:hypothetical protein